MESIAQAKHTGNTFRFGRAPLSPFTLPTISTAVQAQIAHTFMRDEGFMVDFKAHSMFCMEAFKGGLLQEDDLLPLTRYPHGYGLHLVTAEAVKRASSKVFFNPSEVVPAKVAADLSRKEVDIGYASKLALVCHEAGLLHDSVLGPIIEIGPDCGDDLVKASTASLDALFPRSDRLDQFFDARTQQWVDYEFLYTSLQGEELFLCADGLTRFKLNLPSIEGEFVEINTLLFKTLDAMTHFMVPFHTPSSAFGNGGQYLWSLSEVYDSLKEHVETKSRDELIQYLTDLDYSTLDCEIEYLGLDVSSEEGPCSESIERAAEMLLQAADIGKNFSFRLDYSDGTTDETRKAEMVELRSQAKDVIAKDTPYSALLEVLVCALSACIDNADTNFNIYSLDLKSSAEDGGVSAFECLWVTVEGKHEHLDEEACSAFDSYAQECSDLYFGLPVSSAELVAQVTGPIMTRTQQCVSLLRRIQRSLEASPNA